MGNNMDNFKLTMLKSDLDTICELIDVEASLINQHKKDSIIMNLVTYNMCTILDKSLALIADGKSKYIIPAIYAKNIDKFHLTIGYNGKEIPVSTQLVFQKDGKTGIVYYILDGKEELLFLNPFAKELFEVMNENQIANLIKKESKGNSRKKNKNGRN